MSAPRVCGEANTYWRGCRCRPCKDANAAYWRRRREQGLGTTAVCSINGCERTVRARGWCIVHYSRWRKHGDPLTLGDPYAELHNCTVMERIQKGVRVDEESGCWVWLRSITANGYGQMRIGKKTSTTVHRAMYEFVHGAVPKGLDIHHVCENRRCCNPDHLVALTRSEHQLLHYRLRREEQHEQRVAS